MKPILKYALMLHVFLFGTILFSSFLIQTPKKTKFKFPYQSEKLSDRQAAAHLLSRFTYGVKSKDIDAVIETGLENWFLQQLDANQTDDSLNQMLSGYDAINLSNTDVAQQYIKGGQVLRMAIRDGEINKDSISKTDKKAYRKQLEAYMKKKGLKPQQELYRQFINQKILRAAYTNNQMQEVLTDFWFNHFNVSLDKGKSAEFIPAYERDIIRPNVTGTFNNLLLATAKSPAMLSFLDNFSSRAAMTETDPTNMLKAKRKANLMQAADSTSKKAQVLKKLQQNKKNQGLNENYARELMELHTLGVDGGYTQQDVTEAARVLTGWTIYPMGNSYGKLLAKNMGKSGNNKKQERGNIRDGDFLFTSNRHDKNEKTILGKHFPNNGGFDEGVELLNMLAEHPSTATFISRKIAVRFVSDNPPQSLINKMAKTFSEKNGNIREVLITMVSSQEFWNKEALREKTKSPFELAISAVRSLDTSINQPYQLYSWINKMGQKMYYYQAPTGFPDRAQYWINTGALLNRMNFGLALASNRIPGIKINLAALNNHREPESAEAALAAYSTLIMPERNLNETINRLTPMLNDPELNKKIEAAAGKTSVTNENNRMINEDAVIMDDNLPPKLKDKFGKKGAGKNSYANFQNSKADNSILAQVVGIIIGSPEFQRR